MGINTKFIEDITDAEWILYEWIDVTPPDERQIFVRARRRPLDEAMLLAGGSIKDLEPYRWIVDDD